MSAPTKYKIAVVSIGTRGDNQPYINLALQLKSRGHDVWYCSEDRIKPLVEQFGLPWRHIGGDKAGWIMKPEVESAVIDGDMFKLIKLTEELEKTVDKPAILDTYIQALSGADIMITGGLCITETWTACEYLNIKTYLPVILGPTMKTSEYPLWAMKSIAFCNCLNGWTYDIAYKQMWASEKKFINPWRQRLGLPLIENKRGTLEFLESTRPPLIMCCTEVFCGPKRLIPDDYPSNAGCVGFYFTPEEFDQKPDPKLVEFLNTNTNIPCIYLGFGSMPAPKGPQQWFDMAKNLLLKFPKGAVRIVLLMGWNEANAADVDTLMNTEPFKGYIIVIKSVSHNFLFPYMDCIVHHCGFGTMAAALKSGRPQVPLAFYLDQPHNSQIVVDLGCAPSFLKFQSATIDDLHREINKTIFGPDKDKYRATAEKIGLTVRAESQDALNRSCEIIENWHSTKQTPILHNGVLRGQSNAVYGQASNSK